jgi:hypothetical protein
MEDPSLVSRRRYGIQKFPRRWKEILLLLADDGSLNRHQVMRRLSPQPVYSTVHKAAKALAGEGLVSATSEGLSRAGLGIASYTLTVPGLAFVLHNWPSELDWAKMARGQKALLPRVFGRWEFFVNEGVEELAERSLQESVEVFWRDYDWDAGCTNREAAAEISKYFIMTPKDTFEEHELLRWYGILSKDRRLGSWAVGYAEEIATYHAKEAKAWEQVPRLLRSGKHE